MADNTTPSADPTVATDEVGTVHYQMMKLVDGTLEGTDPIPGSSAKGLAVNPRATVERIAVTPTISTSAYSSKDAVGGLLTFASAARSSGGSCRVESVAIVDKAQQFAALDLVLFRDSITAPTDNAAFDPTDAELADVVGIVPFFGGEYHDWNDNAVAFAGNLAIPAVLAGTDLYGVLVARSAPTYAATDDLVVTLHVVQD